ncbi:unnamed protein product [Ilex paraguariensis]|uniref:Pulmonary surfactant-associated protein B n=1 Tax=Ilex paraguariensis TaxID=185542 RepID=A0ABC8RIT1_9AQUA
MDARVGLLFLFVVGASWACNARELGRSDLFAEETRIPTVSVLRLNRQESVEEVLAAAKNGRNEEVCTMCEEFVGDALNYLAENKTQTEITHILHKSCSKLLSFKQECITLVDYYAPLFFLEVSSIQPGDFCRKVNLCGQTVSFSQRLSEDSCGICHHAVEEALLKLKDPDTQLEIIEVLLKACNAVESYVKKCKRMVFEYGPVILINAEQFLESNDICTILQACDSPTASSKQALPVSKTSMLF